MADLQELKAAAEAATPGPWVAFNMTDTEGNPMSVEAVGKYVTNSILKSIEDGGAADRFLFISQSDCGCPDICHVGNGPNGPHNAAFIAAANPAAILSLIAHVERLEAENTDLQQQVREARVKALEEAAKLAEDRHKSWSMPHPDDAKPGEVCDDISACTDIATAILALKDKQP